MTRREALARAAYLLGGVLAAPTVAGVLAGCGGSRGAGEGAAWLPRTLSPEQAKTVAILGEHILPETDTPGARAARVERFIDAMLTDYHPEETRQRFLAGLDRADARARRAFGDGITALPPERQWELVQALNRQAYGPAARPQVPPEQVARPREPLLQQHDAHTGTERTLPVVDSDWDPDDAGPGAFFRTLKELVVVGYYTSEVGATQELRVSPMGVWRADVPFSEIGRAWS
jgi:gluconate 2-dehydrogenase gamma chain